jgi:hypothetical protein
LRRPGSFGRVTGLHHKLSCFIQKHVSGFCELHAPLVAYEKRNPEVFFELADLPAQRWLRDMQLSRRLAEVQVFSDRQKVANVP